MPAASCRHGAQHYPGSRSQAIVGYLWRRVSDVERASAREVRHGLARPLPGRRLRLQPQVLEDLLDHRYVQSARALGHWVSQRQLDSGLCGVAVALRDRKGECKGGVGMTLQASAYTPAQIAERLLPLLVDAAQALRPLL